MAVVLTILKILGIILLCIIGLILLLALIVLLVPIRYKARGQYTEEAVDADFKVRWLFFRVLGTFEKDKGLLVKAKAAWFTVYQMEMGKKTEETGHLTELSSVETSAEQGAAETAAKQEAVQTDRENEPEKIITEGAPSEEEEKVKDAEPAGEQLPVPKDDDSVIPNPNGTAEDDTEDLEIFGSGRPETKKERKARLKREKEEAKARKAEEKKQPKPEKPPEETLEYKMEQFRQKIEKVEKKIDHVRQFLDREATQRTIERAKKLLIKIIKHLKPKKGGIWVHVGLGSAADTGMMLGKIVWLYPVFGKWLLIEPDFHHKVIEVKGDVKGRIRLGSLAVPALIFYLRKDTRRKIKLAKKI